MYQLPADARARTREQQIPFSWNLFHAWWRLFRRAEETRTAKITAEEALKMWRFEDDGPYFVIDR